MSKKTLADVINAERIKEVDLWVNKFPAEHKQSALLQALRIVQDEHGWLSEENMQLVAEYLGVPHIAAFEVASFYNMYNLKPVGKHSIGVCNSIACMLSGSEKIMHHLETRLGVKFGETTSDQKFTLQHAECLGACVNAPVCRVGREYHEHLTTEKVDMLLAELGNTHGK